MNDWDPKANEIFLRAVEAESDEIRAALLDTACQGDAGLRARVEGLLAAHVEVGSFLESPPPGATLGATQLLPGPGSGEQVPGDRVGPYTLLQKLGEGGMGTVWAAEQHHPVRRRVALKLIKPGMDSAQVLRRFEAERQALALMDHTNIARVFDAGTTPEGRPFFAMELVKGVPITKYCDELNLSVRERLELFVTVCKAIQHAHQKGMIHRDVKPSNVLVCIQDQQPVPKVIDFGVAKALHQRLADRTLHTEIGAVIGTLEYMAPEQAELSALDVDTRADVYALGALLYELLTSSTPLDRKRFATAGLAELMRIIREEEPPKPSDRLSESNETLSELAAHRRTEASRLTKEVRGDLDWIVMKCLEKDRTRRYETANAMARDIERHLADEPIEARPPSRGYRLRKCARRNRGSLVAMTLVAVALLSGLAIASWQAIRATNAEVLADKRYHNERRARTDADTATAKAVAAERAAVSEARKSEQVAAFMTEMLQGVGPSVALGRDTTMLHEILDDTTQRLDELKDQPAVEADLRIVLGDVYYDIGEFETAERMFRAALDLRRDLLGSRHADVASALSELGEAIRKQSRFDEAEPLFVDALTIQHEQLGNDHPEVGLTLYRLGMVHNRRRDGARAEPLLREALAISRRHPNRDFTGRRSTAAVLDQLGVSLNHQHKLLEAESVFREALAIQRQQSPSGSPGLATALFNLAGLLRDQGKLADAEACSREALEIRNRQLPPGHFDIRRNMGNLASLLFQSDQASKAIPFADEFVRHADGNAELQEQIPHLIAARFRHFRKSGDVEGCRTSAGMWERQNGTDAGFYYAAARYRAMTAALLRATDKSPEAGQSADIEANHAIDWLKKSVAAGYKDVALLKQEQAFVVLRNRKDFKELIAGLEPRPEEVLAAAIEAVRRGPDDAAAHFGLALALSVQGKPDESVAEFREAIRLKPDFPEAYEKLAGVLRTQRKWDEARALDWQSLEIQIRLAHAAVAERPDVANTYQDRGRFLCRAGRFREALPDLDNAIRLDPVDHWKYVYAAPVHLYLGDVEGYRRVCREMMKLLGKTDRPDVDHRIAKLSLLVPGEQAEVEQLAHITERNLAQGESNGMFDWFRHGHGLLEYRRGRYDEAARMLEGITESKAMDAFSRSFTGVVLAMTYAKNGRTEEALKTLDAATAKVDAMNLTPGTVDLGSGYFGWCMYQVILREARSELSEAISARESMKKQTAERFRRALKNAEELGKAGRWPEAAAILQESIDTAETSSDSVAYVQWYNAAAAWALAGDREAYVRHCRRMLDRYGASSDVQAAQLAGRAALLLPGTPHEDEAVRLVERAIEAAGGRAAPAHYQISRSLAEYRAGRFQQAVEWNDAVLARKDLPEIRRPAHQFVQAMSLSRLGRGDEAREFLAKALDATPPAESSLVGESIWAILRREAIATVPTEPRSPAR